MPAWNSGVEPFEIIVEDLIYRNSFTLSRNTLQIHSNYSPETKVVDVISDPVFQNYGRLIFPVDRHIDRNLMLKDAGDIFVWYNHIIPGRTVEIVNYMKSQAKNGNKIFYDIYTDEEKQKDPWKNEYGERI